MKYLILVLIIIFASCNPTKKAYKGVERYEPKSVADSLRLANRFKTTFPAKPAIIKPGKTTNNPDSVEYYKKLLRIATSKKPIIKKEVELKYKDTCITAQDTYEQGYNLGYDVGLYDGKSKCPPSTVRVDTIQQDDPATIAEIASLRLNQTQRAKINDKLKEELGSAKKSRNKWAMWFLILVGVYGVRTWLLKRL